MASYRIACLTLVIVVTACASNRAPLRNSDSPLADTQWQLQAIAGESSAIQTPHPITLGIEETAKEIRGRGPCNRYFGNVQISDDDGTFIPGALAATKMYCGQPEGLMDLELKFMSAFSGIRQFERRDQTLLLQDASGADVLTFEQVIVEPDL